MSYDNYWSIQLNGKHFKGVVHIPFGNFYKKNKAEEIIRSKVKDATIGRKMLWLIGLVPEKKSLLLAQKALNYRRIDKVMKAFFDIEVAPITISKRHAIKKLDNIYNYLWQTGAQNLRTPATLCYIFNFLKFLKKLWWHGILMVADTWLIFPTFRWMLEATLPSESDTIRSQQSPCRYHRQTNS